MAKKNKAGQQRSKEEQWRKRMAAQARSTPPATVGTATAVKQSESTEYSPANGNGAAAAFPSSKPTTATAPARPRVDAAAPRAAAPAAQRRTTAPPAARTARSRIVTQSMSIDEEMHYVRADIRMLIMLTAACLVVLIVLSFIIK